MLLRGKKRRQPTKTSLNDGYGLENPRLYNKLIAVTLIAVVATTFGTDLCGFCGILLVVSTCEVNYLGGKKILDFDYESHALTN